MTKKAPKTNIVDEVFTKSSAFLLSRFGADLRRRFTEAMDPLGLSWQGQNIVTALHALTKYGAVSQKQLADFVGIDPRNLVPIIDALERLTMLKRMPNPTDRRGYEMQLTAQGEAMAEQTKKIRARIEKDMLVPLSPDERKILHELLKKLWEHSDISRGSRLFSTIDHSEKNEGSNIK